MTSIPHDALERISRGLPVAVHGVVRGMSRRGHYQAYVPAQKNPVLTMGDGTAHILFRRTDAGIHLRSTVQDLLHAAVRAVGRDNVTISSYGYRKFETLRVDISLPSAQFLGIDLDPATVGWGKESPQAQDEPVSWGTQVVQQTPVFDPSTITGLWTRVPRPADSTVSSGGWFDPYSDVGSPVPLGARNAHPLSVSAPADSPWAAEVQSDDSWITAV